MLSSEALSVGSSDVPDILPSDSNSNEIALRPNELGDVDIVHATQYGKFEVVRQLIESGQHDVNQLDKEGISLLHWAAINNRLQMVRYLIMKGALIDRRCGDLNTNALQWAIRQGHLQMVVLLLHYGSSPLIPDVNGLNSLHVASQSGHTPIVAYLVAKGSVDVDCRDEQNGRTPLMHAILHSPGDDPTRLLINLGASVNKTDASFGNTALHYALGTNNYGAVTKLLNCNASADIPNKQGETVKDSLTSVSNSLITRRIQKHIETEDLTSRRNWRTFHKNPKTIDKITFALPFFCMGLIGLVLESYLNFILKIVSIFAVATAVKYFSGKFLTFNSHQILPFSTYLAQKVLMYFTWSHYYWNEVSSWANCSLLLVSIFLCYYFYKTVFSDPGFLKRSMEAKKQAIISFVECEDKGMDNFSSFCTTCILRRPIRSKHCVVCKQCVAKMDHHCPWVFNCVAANNHSFFVNFLFFLECIITLFMGATAVYIWHYTHGTLSTEPGLDVAVFGGLFGYREAPDLISSAVQTVSIDSPVQVLGWFSSLIQFCCNNQWIVFIASLSMLYWIWVGALFGSQCYQMFCVGMTTNEFLNRHRYKHFKLSPEAESRLPTDEREREAYFHRHRANKCRNKAYSPFQNGFMQNVADFYQVSFCGLLHPNVVDWTHVYSVDEVTTQTGCSSSDHSAFKA
ncbi:palmitoyltransferase ZDHHC17-like [Symsagittifera roscoffensis]|uniref:palmitoyltransferase ZDHHC17-like n=1 Tax=Symsagittifera roscoffensis TaxID=84072 RepID=UPI00307C7AA9